ncbi:MAG: hypothetical protein Q9201_001707 [Fulgogasparrea decipioides]
MQKMIQLSEQEATLRQLLLDVSGYIGTLEGCSKPQLRFTGGWVRDKLLGVGSQDIDIGIDSMTGFKFGTLMNQYLEKPEAQEKYPTSKLGKLAKIAANPEKSKHLETATTKILGFEIDLVNLRKETYTEDSRNPQMEFGTPEDDALRRDATVNALFYNLDKAEIEDFTGRGLQDMERGVIKTPLSPYQTFKDDPLRVLRAIRFASRLGYRIDETDEQAMGDRDIRDALKVKITRERVGVELTKMLKGPDPMLALSLIERLGLYHTIFSFSSSENSQQADTRNWAEAYHEAQRLTIAGPNDDHGAERCIINSILLRDSDDIYHMWLLSALVPFARVPPPAPKRPNAKASPSSAATAAREGIKADNNTIKVIENAAVHLNEIVHIKDTTVNKGPSTASPLRRKQDLNSHEVQGMAIRRWGPSWRSSVMFALLTQMNEVARGDHRKLLEGYATWLSTLKDLDLLEVYQLKPLVTGDKLSKALGVKPGPWMSKALEMVVAWQLRNPDEQSEEAAISEIISKKKELSLG